MEWFRGGLCQKTDVFWPVCRLFYLIKYHFIIFLLKKKENVKQVTGNKSYFYFLFFLQSNWDPNPFSDDRSVTYIKQNQLVEDSVGIWHTLWLKHVMSPWWNTISASFSKLTRRNGSTKTGMRDLPMILFRLLGVGGRRLRLKSTGSSCIGGPQA